MSNIRHCSCGVTHGITHKGFTLTKIFRCDEHGFICPFDTWQFKTPEELLEHFGKTEREDVCPGIICEGQFRFGDYFMQEAIFELKTYIKEHKNNEKTLIEMIEEDTQK